MRQYGIDQVEATWAGLDLKTGIASGTSIVVARTAPSWTQKPTGNGKAIRVYNPDRSGSVTITVDQTSLLHQQLKAIALLDRTLRNQVFALVIADNSSDESHVYGNAYLASDPPPSLGTEADTYEWVLNYESFESAPQLGNANLVGS